MPVSGAEGRMKSTTPRDIVPSVTSKDFQEKVDLAMTEAQWQQIIIDAARALQWLVYHTYDSRRSNPGWPDLILVKPPRLIALEVKKEKGRVRPEQIAWIDALGQIPGVTAAIVRPSDWDRVEKILKGEDEILEVLSRV